MSEYLIQSETLDDIADAINAKTGGSSAMTPAQMVTEIGSISNDGLPLDDVVFGNKPSGAIIVNNAGVPRQYSMAYRPVESVHFSSPLSVSISQSMFQGCSSLVSISGVFIADVSSSCVVNCSAFRVLDGYIGRLYAFALQQSGIKILVLRNATKLTQLLATSAFSSTPFASGGSGGTIYIPKAMYGHLGDGTSLDYKNATNWSTVDAYGTVTWAQIEGSIYETQYADGTPIPTT